MSEGLKALHLAPIAGHTIPGLVPVSKSPSLDRVDEIAATRQAADIGGIDYIFFRRFSDGRSSQVGAYVIDNDDEHYNEEELAKIHRKVWLNGSAPLLFIGWPSRVDVLTCAAGPVFWKKGRLAYGWSERIETTAAVSHAMSEKQHQFSAFRLSDGTFWDDPRNANLANADEAAHRRLISAVVAADTKLRGASNPLLRRLLLLTILIKYLEDRGVFPSGWFERRQKNAACFHDVLRLGSPETVRGLLLALENKFNGDVFELPEKTHQRLTTAHLRELADLVEARTEGDQRYLWGLYSFEHIPVEVLSHLYQRFAQSGRGAVFTPSFVANLILDYALPYNELTGKERILDPTCGSGVFLVGAFRRLVHFWQSKHGWKRPDVSTLKTMLKRSIFGVELQKEAIHLTAFSLALAICDALQPNVIWTELKFDKLVGSNLLTGDLFDCFNDIRAASGKDGFSSVVGNPPFLSKLSEAAVRRRDEAGRTIPIPDNQMAYFIAEQAMTLLGVDGKLCLIQPSGLLYNEKPRAFQQAFIRANQVEAVLDFTSVRKLYDGADPKTVALIVRNIKPNDTHRIHHFTFRRTFSVRERIGFELDHYDRHWLSQQTAEKQPWIWRANLLGGGRLVQLTARMAKMPTLSQFIVRNGWDAGEGYIAGKSGHREPAKWLTGKDLLPTKALSTRGINTAKIGKVKDELFTAPRTEARYAPPLVLIKEHESLPCGFWNEGFLAYKHKIVGIRGEPSQADLLRRFSEDFSANRELLRALCLLLGTQALVGKATAILKRDIDTLPWPQNGKGWDLTNWEKILCEDVVGLTSEFVRRGQNSKLLRQRVTAQILKNYAEVFVHMLGSVYKNLRPAKGDCFDGVAYQSFCFGKEPDLDWPDDWADKLREVIYIEHGEVLRTVRVLRFYEGNMIIIVKPDRLRYWIRSTAIRDADETLVEMRNQGY